MNACFRDATSFVLCDDIQLYVFHKRFSAFVTYYKNMWYELVFKNTFDKTKWLTELVKPYQLK